MKLYEKIPDSVTVNGRKVKVNLEYRNVLRMIDILKEDDLLPDAREWLAMKCICRRPRKGMKAEVMKLLFDDPKKNAERERITDLGQDADLIRAAFMQEYGINLFREKLNWFEFSCLLAGLPEGSKYTEILGIRARPMPDATQYNAKEREWLARAKTEYALELTEEEQQRKYRKDVEKLGAFLIALAGEDEKHG